MKSILLIALIASLFIAQVICGPLCQYTNTCGPGEFSSEMADVQQNTVPQTGFIPNSAFKGCVFNCEWFVRTARRNDPSKPCTLQRGRNGRFRDNCVQEQVCTGCRSPLVMAQQPFYLSTSDTAPRCPSFPEDLDAFTTAQLSAARDICRTVGKCSCVSGDISPEVISVRE